jgi:NAD(P)-dependent dehydrogenase (short-subunit alcohol dehydrogenase family)
MKLLLIGMGPGNGAAIARRFGREGFEILMVARHEDKLRDFERELAAEGIRSRGYAVDVADEDSYLGLLDHLVRDHRDVDIVHYNASAYNPATPSQISLPTFLNDLKTNVVGALLAAQAYLPHLQQRERPAIFITGGGSALHPSAGAASLGIGKAAVRNLALALAEECRPLGIHVATLTIMGNVKPGTAFDPDKIAEGFWQLYRQPRDQWEAEVLFKG